jgi:hypothetical protein
VEVDTGFEVCVEEKEAGLYMFTASTWRVCRVYSHYCLSPVLCSMLSFPVTQPRRST